MKKVLLVSLFLVFSALTVWAYETVIIKFPDGENWIKSYYKKVGAEAILQYVPKGQSSKSWTRSIIVHSYNEATYPISVFMANNVAMMTKTNPTASYKYLILRDTDAMAGRCTKDYKGVMSQCEFFRATRAHNGIITIHYINKDKDDFMKNYRQWFDIIKKAKFLNTYWRNERTLNKSEFFELW